MPTTVSYLAPWNITLPDAAVTVDPRTGEAAVDLSTMPTAADVTAAQDAADAAQATADAAEASAATFNLTVAVPDIDAVSGLTAVAWVLVPEACTLVGIAGALTVQPTVAAASLFAVYGGNAVTGSGLSWATTDAAGTVKTAAGPFDPAAIAANTAIGFAVDGANTAAGVAHITLTFQKT